MMELAARKALSSSGSQESGEDPPCLLINRQRKYRIDRTQILEFLTEAAQYTAPQASFSVVLLRDSAIRRYNRDYRGQDQSTDVLSFRGDDAYLGDILISLDAAWEQARRSRSLTLEKNVRRLALHGLLHLMGYDHETDSGEMRALESRLRRRLQC